MFSYMFSIHVFTFFYIFGFLKNRKHFTSTNVFHFPHIITGRSWADHGAIMGDHAKHARFQKSWPLRGVANIKFSAFLEMKNMFFKISNALFRQSWKKRFPPGNQAIWCWTWRYYVIGERYLRKYVDDLFVPLRYHQQIITYFFPRR